MTLEVREYGINLAHLEPGDCYRTLLTDRVGTLREKLHWGHRVEWRDLRGPEIVHRELVVQPWPRGTNS